MTTIQTSFLTGKALDWAVAKAVNHPVELAGPSMAGGVVLRDCLDPDFEFSPSSDWAQCGPLIESNEYDLLAQGFSKSWACIYWIYDGVHYSEYSESGPSPLVAVCRAMTAAKLGGEVEVPGELL